ncbi:MAG: hypothetical protein U9N84_09095 [Actinomycetota bacterium]|nr:hypothetical protein [Actinomycetota bacterium]
MIGGVVAVVAAGVVLGVIRRIRSTQQDRDDAVVEGGAVKHPVHEFHVVDDEALVVFDVPLPTGDPDPVLRDLLLHHAVELIRDRRRRGQPLDGLTVARVSANRAGVDVEVGSIDLSLPEGLPEIELPILLPIGASPDDDPLRKLGESDMDQVVLPAEVSETDHLAPLGEELRLTAGIAAGLRGLGVDPESMTVTEFGLGILELAGYDVTRSDDGTYVASRGGSLTLIMFVPHEPGGYPELSRKAISEFLVRLAAARTDRGLLVTDKYGPYEIYKKERANPHGRFITRERLQAFVDSVALG